MNRALAAGEVEKQVRAMATCAHGREPRDEERRVAQVGGGRG